MLGNKPTFFSNVLSSGLTCCSGVSAAFDGAQTSRSSKFVFQHTRFTKLQFCWGHSWYPRANEKASTIVDTLALAKPQKCVRKKKTKHEYRGHLATQLQFESFRFCSHLQSECPHLIWKAEKRLQPLYCTRAKKVCCNKSQRKAVTKPHCAGFEIRRHFGTFNKKHIGQLYKFYMFVFQMKQSEQL